jgi:hypothetical protein
MLYVESRLDRSDNLDFAIDQELARLASLTVLSKLLAVPKKRILRTSKDLRISHVLNVCRSFHVAVTNQHITNKALVD